MSKKKDKAVEDLVVAAEEAVDTGVDWSGMPPAQRKAHARLAHALDEVEDAEEPEG